MLAHPRVEGGALQPNTDPGPGILVGLARMLMGNSGLGMRIKMRAASRVGVMVVLLIRLVFQATSSGEFDQVASCLHSL